MSNLRVITRPVTRPSQPFKKSQPIHINRPARSSPRYVVSVQPKPMMQARTIATPNKSVIKIAKSTNSIRNIIKPPSKPITRTPQPTRALPPKRPAKQISDQELKIPTILNIGTDRTLIIVAAGPSVKEVDFTPLLNLPKVDFMCVNKPYKPVWPSKFWSFCDHSQYDRNKEEFFAFNGTVLNSINVTARRRNQVIFRTRPGNGFSLDSQLIGGYHVGKSSTYASMQIANYMNYPRVYIFGVDMTEVNGQLHHYGQNPDVDNERRKTRFKSEAEYYMWAGTHLSDSVRNRFTFCSSYNPWPFLKYFKNLDHKFAVDIIKAGETS